MAEGLCGDVGGTITPPAYTLNVTANGTYPASQYSQVVVNVGGGGGESYNLVGTKEFTANTTSTSQTNIEEIIPDETVFQTGKIVYVKIRDKAGKRNGYFYGSDQWAICLSAANGTTTSVLYMPTIMYGITSSGKFAGPTDASTYSFTGYGVYVSSITSAGKINIATKYNSSLGTINGTFVAEVYLLDWPGDVSPLE